MLRLGSDHYRFDDGGIDTLSGGKAQRLTDQGIVNLHILDGWLYFGMAGCSARGPTG